MFCVHARCQVPGARWCLQYSLPTCPNTLSYDIYFITCGVCCNNCCKHVHFKQICKFMCDKDLCVCSEGHHTYSLLSFYLHFLRMVQGLQQNIFCIIYSCAIQFYYLLYTRGGWNTKEYHRVNCEPWTQSSSLMGLSFGTCPYSTKTIVLYGQL